MLAYKAPVDRTMFLLNDVLDISRYARLPAFAGASEDVVAAVANEFAKFAEEILLPLNRTGDVEGCVRHNDGTVTTPPGYREAYSKFAEGGWIGLSSDPAYGGQGLPFVLASVVGEFGTSANMAFYMFPGLANSAIAAFTLYASEEQKRIYLPKLITGEWTATMNLTEPQAGTDLGLIRTRAKPNDDGSFEITGTKIFVTGGEHDLADNIVHLLLARIDGAPDGSKGISLFVVPKFIPDSAGNIGERNALECLSIENKMGVHASPTCVMGYDSARGWLVGERDKGLRAMFAMMNEARLAVGIQALALSEIAGQNAAKYALERRQGRAISGVKNLEGDADPIIVHPEIRRTLVSIQGFSIAARAVTLSACIDADIVHCSPDQAERQAADDRLGLMTPVIKGVLTDRNFFNVVAAQQVFGGHGYIAETGMEQLVRDARITMIYEGTNGIQALDLVGRKLPRNGGRAIMAYFKEIEDFVKENGGDDDLAPFISSLKAGLDDLQKATMWFMQNAISKPENAAAGATDYMHLFGLVALNHMWARIAKTARERIDAGDPRAEWLEQDILIGRAWIERAMPETSSRLAGITVGADSVMAVAETGF